MRLLPSDLRDALRSARRRPLVFLAAAFVLALGIGGSTAVFSVVDAVLLEPLPFASPERLVVYWQSSPEQSAPFIEVSYPHVRQLRSEARTLAGVAAMPGVNSGFVIGGPEPFKVDGRIVTGNFFETLGARAALGRTFDESEDKVGAPRVVVVSHGLWQRQFGSDPALVGRTLRIEGTAMTVIGVMPREFRYPAGAELWTPLVPVAPHVVEDPRVGWATVIARLAPGATLEEARGEIDGLAKADHRQHAPGLPPVEAVLTPLRDVTLGPSKRALPVMMGAVLLVLLIACANVAALLLARAASRQKDIAVRLALGASRARVVRHLLAESVLVAVAGGAAGTLIAAWGVRALVRLVPAEVPRIEEAALDGRVLAFAILLTALSALAAGLLPALVASRASLLEVLVEATRTASPGARQARARAVLVGAEAALALVLLSGALLLGRTFQNLSQVPLGFDPQGVLTAELNLPPGRYEKEPERLRQLHREMVAQIEAIPGVEAAAAVMIRPLWGRVGLDWPSAAEGQPEAVAARNPPLNLQVVTHDFFRAMKMPVRQGRTFADTDTAGVTPVLVVSDALARHYWPGQDPIGKRVKMPMPSPPYEWTWITVAGVVGQARYRELQVARMDAYMTYLQAQEPLRHLVVRTAGDPMSFVPALRGAVRAVDGELILDDVRTMSELVDVALGGARFAMQLLAGFALAALLLAAVGIYGVVAFMVSRRTREVGIRMALGARAGDVLGLVLRDGMMPVLAGVAAGLAAALALARVGSSLLFEVRPHDPPTLAAAAAVVALAALLACAVPAWRVARVDPARALREE